ncbi:P-loop ATPase, Sll1717 family [Paraburkholderia sp. 35.1]|uniref:P-loop ATPase, Sll1717 family n=1 Tax=Paraburkholderia sp. 35.1 TaxID=2991058 RepID=UPI003D250C4C
MRKILLDCLAIAGEDAKYTFARGSFEFARGVAREIRKSSMDIAENITEILTSIKAKAGKLGEFGLVLEKELRAAAEADALEHHTSEIAKTGKQFVVLIDDLDQGWDNSELANNLLLGLLSASAYISAKIPNLYCCVFLREDVYSILVSKTQHADKYRNIERIKWDRNGLISILNERIAYNRREHEAEPAIDLFHSVFPEMVGTTYADNWLIERTLSRPRELIQLARNYTKSVSDDKPSDTALKNSEIIYSSWKLQDVCSEYSNQYPNLLTLFNTWKAIFNRHKYSYKKTEIVDKLETLLLEVAINETWLNEIMSHKHPEIELLLVLYEIGVVGDYVAGGSGGGAKVYYSFADTHEPRFDEVHFHPCFRKGPNMVERIRN